METFSFEKMLLYDLYSLRYSSVVVAAYLLPRNALVAVSNRYGYSSNFLCLNVFYITYIN